jgi:hypothetical protein
VAKHQFLSDDWFTAVTGLVETHGAEGLESVDLVLNVVVTDTPFGGERQLFMATRSGHGEISTGHAEDADVTITSDYDTAKEVFASGHPESAVELFMAGRLRIQGDLAKLLSAQASGSATGNAALLEAVHEITE